MEENLDAGEDQLMLDLEHRLGHLPYIAPLGSCEGHAYKVLPKHGFIADRGSMFIFDGFMNFKVMDPRHRDAQPFLTDFNGLAERYSFVDFYEDIQEDRHDNSMGKYHRLVLGMSDLISGPGQQNVEIPADVQTLGLQEKLSLLSQCTKQSHQVPYSSALRRIAEYRTVWAEVSDIIDKYVSRLNE